MKKFQKSKVLLISFAHFTHDIFSALLAPILPLLISRLGITLTEASFLDIARKVPSLFNPFLGLIAERNDAKYFVILTPSITAVSMGLLSLTSSYAVALFLLFVAGLSAAFFHIPSPTMIKEFSGKESGKGMSYFMVGGESARTVGPILAAGVISLWGLDGIWKLTPIGIISSLFLYYKLKDYKTTFNAKKFEKGEIKGVLNKVKPFFKMLTLFIMFNYTSKYAMSLYLPLFLTHHGYSVESASIAFGILQGFGILGAFFAGRFSDKIGRVNMLMVSALGSAVSLMFFLLFFKQFLWFLLAPLGFFLFTSSPVLLAFVHDLKTDKPTFVNSIYMGINFGVSSVIVYLVGLVGEKIGLFKTFEITVVLTLISIFFINRLKK
ncbi:MFS transporter [Nautilia sp. PV-1]|jgi:FSR family fosmidomycin resistance protein-like MFS transporter|uniref:MFS transporter n=1 Tax=Nautilia sp. PV-1 TaxID=2579250 RepID=UPI000FDAA576|nr:MFS transporter [Nautilia sp. PV-1]AZV46411.1 MFS transporter [Nautilia sp. PV-1]